jgi:5'-nucleotidase (lipoprotein e(P4) family)
MPMPTRTIPALLCALALASLACERPSADPAGSRSEAGAPAPAPTPAPAPAPAYDPAANPALLATLYAQTSSEHHASTRAIYRAAQTQLDAALKDRKWTAALEQGEKFGKKPPAIVLDVDETVLDNSPYQVKTITENLQYPAGWNEWCDAATAKPIPGALELTQYAASKGVTVFYLTNRDHEVEAGTRKNLEAAGFPLAEGVDVVLTQNERPEWTSDKTSRRAFLAEDYRIVMLFGDNLGDFVAKAHAKGQTLAEREGVVEQHADKWGTRWFVIPNPLYGDWDSITFAHDYERDAAAKTSARLEAMQAF